MFFIVFILIGVLNTFLVHPVPGVLYALLSLIYLPPLNHTLRKRFGISTPRMLKIIFGIAVLWGTLGVGDLMELYESKTLQP